MYNSHHLFTLSKRKKIIGFLVLSFLLILTALFSRFIPKSISKPAYVADSLIIKYSDEFVPDTFLSEDKKKKLASIFLEIGVVSEEKMFQTDDAFLKNYYLFKLKPQTNVLKAKAILDKHKEIGISQPDYFASIQKIPNDPLYQQLQWGMRKIHMEEAWDITDGSNSLMIGVVDTGVDYNHEDLPSARIVKGKDYISCDQFSDTGGCIAGKTKTCPKINFGYCDDDPLDDNGHGTHVSGTIGALTNNAVGTAGVNWNAKLFAVKVLNAEGSGPDSLIAQGIKDAVDAGVKILNLSFTSDSSASCAQQPVYQDAIHYASQRGVIVISAAGNKNDLATYPPASCDGVISVGATDQDDSRGNFSNFGTRIDIAAPGVGIVSTKSRVCDTTTICRMESMVDGNYVILKGTSMAAPHVSAVAALLLSAKSDLTPSQVADCIKNGGDSITTDRPIGKRLNALKALQLCTSSGANPTPVVSSTIPVFFARLGSTQAVTTLSLNPSSSASLDVYIDLKTTNSNGFDIVIKTQGAMTITQLVEGADALKFNSKVFNEISDSGHTLRYTKVNTDTEVAITGLLRIGTVTFAASQNSGSGTIDFSKVTITSATSNTSLPVTAFPVSYTVLEGANITPSPTTGPAVTPKPSCFMLVVNPTTVKVGQPLDVSLQECLTPIPTPQPPSSSPKRTIIIPGWLRPLIPPLPPFLPFIIEFDDSIPSPFGSLFSPTLAATPTPCGNEGKNNENKDEKDPSGGKQASVSHEEDDNNNPC